jgi:hypothetical protein
MRDFTQQNAMPTRFEASSHWLVLITFHIIMQAEADEHGFLKALV